MRTCPACNSEIEFDESIFCTECGFNFSIQEKTEQIKQKELEYKTHYESNIDQDHLLQYEQIQAQIDALVGIDEEFNQQQTYYQTIQNEYDRAESIYRQQEFATQKEHKDVEDLKKLTWTSIKARVKGNREELLEKEEAEYFDAMNKKQAALEDLEKMRKQLDLAQEQYNVVKKEMDRKQSLEKQLIQVIHQATEGVADPVEDRIEEELEQLNMQRQPLQEELHKLRITRDAILGAKNYFIKSERTLNGAMSAANWDTFGGGGFFSDSIKRSKMADARNTLQHGYRNLQIAYNNYPNLPRVPYVQVEEGSFFWDVAFDNFFSDMRSRDRIRRAQDNVRNAIYALENPLSWINQQTIQVEQQDHDLKIQLQEKMAELTRERHRMVRDALGK